MYTTLDCIVLQHHTYIPTLVGLPGLHVVRWLGWLDWLGLLAVGWLDLLAASGISVIRGESEKY